MKQVAKDETLKTEFLIESDLGSTVDIVQESVSANNFFLEPFRFSEYATAKKSFYVMYIDSRTQRKYCCGVIDLIKHKDNEVLVRLDSSRGATNNNPVQNTMPLERVFYVLLQQFIQRGLFQVKS